MGAKLILNNQTEIRIKNNCYVLLLFFVAWIASMIFLRYFYITDVQQFFATTLFIILKNSPCNLHRVYYFGTNNVSINFIYNGKI